MGVSDFFSPRESGDTSFTFEATKETFGAGPMADMLREVADTVFDRYRVPLYKEASYKPYVIAAMIFLARLRHPADKLREILNRAQPRQG